MIFKVMHQILIFKLQICIAKYREYIVKCLIRIVKHQEYVVKDLDFIV